jgi:glutamate dehydrogenase
MAAATITTVARPQSARRRQLVIRLLRAWRASLPAAEWQQVDAAMMRTAAASQLDFGAQRARRQTLLRVFSPALDPMANSSYSVVELITDDMPFLVDTLNMSLAEAGHAVQLIVHPIIAAVRDVNGRLLRIGEHAGARPPVSESWQYLRIDRAAGEQECAALRTRLLAALADVRRACEDWQAMRRAARQLREHCSRHPPPLPAAAVAECAELLNYMEDNHFTFLGYSRSRRVRRAGRTRLEPLRGSELGILRAARRPRDGAAPSTSDLALRRATRELVVVTKANRRSTVHRPGYLDCVAVKEYDRRGHFTGEAQFLGLWTSNTYHADPRTVPLLRLKVARVIAGFPFRPSSHDSKRLVNILENLPRDELFQASVAELRQCARAVLALHERARGVCLVLRRDELRRFWSCLVYLGRERLDNETLRRIEAVLRRALGGGQLDSSLAVGDAPLAQLHVTVRVSGEAQPAVNRRTLQRDLDAALVTWRDRLRAALRARYDEASAADHERRYANAFPPAYQQDVPPALAVQDIADLDSVAAAGAGLLRLRPAGGADRSRAHLRLVRRGEPLAISEALPILESFGLGVIAERPYQVSLPGDRPAWIQDFELEAPALHLADADALETQLNAAYTAILAGELDSDGFHRLIVSAGLTVMQTRVLRACCRYLLQTGIPFSQAYMERVLHGHAHIAGDLWRLFERRLDPAATDRRALRDASAIERRLLAAIGEVRNPDDDRILRSFLALILATARTNYFRDNAIGQVLAFKLQPRAIPGLPEPRPDFEIFIHGTRVEGVHMRRGPIARGGIRWSERPEDFRTEVLGLMKAQHVKNTLIVPVGAKGGFVARRLRPAAAPEERAREVLQCYQAYIRCLLDVTDNIIDGKVVAPRRVRARDGHDPYLVVAADKGTASYSDVANAISAEYGFWLGDAFASGGSAGYDHKKMGITARGAWECVKRHFRELGLDIMRQPFTVAGIGDMSGDVFGNGMLLSAQIRLLAAFDHRHIFIDPDPDPRRSFRERARLYALPRSSWADYDRGCLSAGGAILERSQKTVVLTPQARTLLALDHERAAPIDVVRAILKLPVDLLWNGGIGTYVKASAESHGEIGDRANDAVRVNGAELRARVVGEGGNLGCSQRGRIEYAQHGGRINTDFVDNSAGVNTSDIEVNLKIMLAGTAGGPAPQGARRRALLAGVTDEVAAQVLRNNYLQSQAISLLEQRSIADLGDHQQLLRVLERDGDLNRALEFLPSDTEIEERVVRGRGLTRPELAVLLAYGKIALNHALTEADIAADPYLAGELERYFPARWRQRFAARIAHHRLRSQLIATATTNSMLNRMDPGFVMRMAAQTGVDTSAVARAYTIARDSAGLRELWLAIEALDNRVGTAVQYEALLATRDYVEQLTRRLLLTRTARRHTDIGVEVARLTPAFATLQRLLPAILPGIAHDRFEELYAQQQAAGMPAALASRLAGLPALRATPDLAAIVSESRRPLPVVAQHYFRTAAALGIDWLAEAIRRLRTTGSWQAVARERLYTACLDGQRVLAARALRERAGDGAVLQRWLTGLGAPGQQWFLTLRELRAIAAPDLAGLMAGAEALRNLAQ